MTFMNIISFDLRYFTLLFAVFLIGSCSESETPSDNCPDTSDNSGPIEIRVRNISDYDYKEVFVDSNDGTHDYCDILSGDQSNYKRFQSAYRYAFVELMIDGSVYTIQPIDFVGETLLNDGKYTYVINASDEDQRYGRLDISLEED